MESGEPIRLQISNTFRGSTEITPEMEKQMNSLLFHIGVPENLEMVDKFTFDDGGKIVIFSLEGEDTSALEGRHWKIPSKVEWWKWQSDEKMQNHLWDRLHEFIGGKVVTLANPSEKHKVAVEKFTKIFQKVLELSNFDNRSCVFLTKENKPTINTLKNYRWVDDGLAFDDLKDKLKGSPAFVIAAGPSLTEMIPHLQKIYRGSKRPFLICAGRTYKLLMKNGIKPDWIVEVEMFEWDHKIWTFAPEPDHDQTLAFPLCVDPSVVTDWPAQKCALIDLNTRELMKFKNALPGGNSILHWMMNSVVYLGCDPITLIGADLGYPDGSKDTHAEGTFHSWPREIQRVEHGFQDELWIPSNDGKPVRSSPAYANFVTLCEMLISKSGRKFFNASLHGAKIQGCETVDLSTFSE